MKRLFALLLSLALLLCGCNRSQEPYQPTGDALDSGDGSNLHVPDHLCLAIENKTAHERDTLNFAF